MNAPTLLIGLGGTGCKIIARVSKMVTEEQRANIAFAAFDTDINELREIQREHPFVRIIQTSTKQTVGEYLNKDTHARDTWFPVNAILNGKTLTEGAGQVRSISRLALETVIRAGKMEPLHEAIRSLYRVEEDKVEQALRVILVSSLAGGTGSGLILPVALYVRNYLKTHFRQSANITRGFFILPEVFYEVIKSQTERNNLKANAYATLRELDAFLMKGDATLPKQYEKTVRMQFPRAASEGYEEYEVRPYDFCFLFDAQNADGGKLNDFEQYIDHAANCIFSQSIGPMNKRSNSSEDNTIRKLAKERGRNRYAGAGASMLIYPFEDIRKLIALKWAKQSVSEQWLVFDNQYKEMKKENQQKREDGMNAVDQPLDVFYVNQVESAAKHDEPFARALVRSTGEYKNGVTRTGDKWKNYVGGVKNKIAQDLREGTSDLRSAREDATIRINELGNDWEDYAAAFEAMEVYQQKAVMYAEEVAQTIGYSMFRGSKNSAENDQDYRLETHLESSDNNFMHPNAIRFMLIKILDLLKKEKASVDMQEKRTKSFFETFEQETFDDPKTDDVVEGAESLGDRKVSVISKLTKRPTGDQEDMKTSFRQYMANAEAYLVQRTQAIVLSQGIDYIAELIEAFELFFQSFDSKVQELDRNIEDIYRKYSHTKGTTVRYVCATRDQMDKIVDKKPYLGSAVTIDSDLAKDIYKRVLDYALERDKPNVGRYFGKLFDEGIIGYFTDTVTKAYGLELDVDIIRAIEMEAEMGEAGVDNRSADDIDQYVRKVINDTRTLSCPFIESPLGETREPLYACTFNKSMRPERGDESPRAQLIRAELMNHGGAPDEDISKYMIMFYQSFYGLRANDLSKFAPPEKAMTEDRSGGEYFTAYYELVSGIHPETHRSKEISPHIDRWWHNVTKMPDLDEGNQKKQEYNIFAAFFWGLLGRYLELQHEGTEQQIYTLRSSRLRMEDDELLVSNGTKCDRLYEVLDAIAIYPELVETLVNEARMETKEDLNENRPLEEGFLFTSLEQFRVLEPRIGKTGECAQSIFDLPMLMKKSATPETYFEENALMLLKVELEELRVYLENFCSAKELPGVMGKVIMEQFDKHLEAVALESVLHPDIYQETLFIECCDIIALTLDGLGLKKEKKAVQSRAEKLKAEAVSRK